MFSILSMGLNIFTNKKFLMPILIGIACLGMYTKYNFMQDEIVNQKLLLQDKNKQINTLQILNNNNLEQVTILKNNYNLTIKTLEKKFKSQKQKQKIITIIKERIKYVKKANDGDVAPILRNTLSRLRTAQNNNSTKNISTKSKSSNATN